MGVADVARFITCHEGTQLNRVFRFFLNLSKFITEWTLFLFLTGMSKHLMRFFVLPAVYKIDV